MINLDKIAEELFNKIRGRYPSITIGDESSTITNVPTKARFFDFDFKEGVKVNVTLDEKSITILYNNDLIEGESDTIKSSWYNFMKEMRTFAKKRMLNFDTRNITKTNLDKRDYQYLSQNRPGEETMSESKMYGTSKTSFQDIGNAKMIVKHRGPVDFENPAGRTQQIDSIYIESAEGERFKYPFRHLNGARAMATHVSEGGNQYDSFGKHIVSLSEELSKLRTFKTYMNRSAVMAEGLAGYMDIVNTRIDTIKETVFKLQRPTHYKEAFESFEETVMEEVPEDVSSNWIDELTIRQFNEELKSVFPYIYNLVKENTKPTEIGPEDLLGEFDGPDETEDGGKKEQLKAWYDKYNKHMGNNGDKLADGFFEAYLDTGILTDATETNEFAKAVDDVFGGDRYKAEEELFGNDDLRKKHLPITYAMHEEFEKIMGAPVGATSPEDMEDNVEKAAKILGDEVVGFSLEGMNMEEADGGKKEQLQAWYDKYSKYEGTNDSNLVNGMIKAWTDSGILSDAYEDGEWADYLKKVGKESDELSDEEHDAFLSPENAPISYAMKADLTKIMGEWDGEETMNKVEKILGLDEGMNMEDAYASHLDNVVATSKHEQGPEVGEADAMSTGTVAVGKKGKTRRATGINDNPYDHNEGEDETALANAALWNMKDVYQTVMSDTPLSEDDMFSYGDLVQYLEQADMPDHYSKFWDLVVDAINDAGGFAGQGSELAVDKNIAPKIKSLYQQFKAATKDIAGVKEGNEFAQKVQALKAKGAKPGTKFKTSDGEEHTLEDAIRLAGLQVEDFWTAEELMAEKGADDDTMDVKIDKDGAISKADAPDKLHDKEEELPLDEFIKGHFDYTTNQFPKGETAVMTAVEKKYGDEAMRDAMTIMKELVTNQDEEMARIKTLAGLAH